MNIVDESPKDSGLRTRALVVGDMLGPSSVVATADRTEEERDRSSGQTRRDQAHLSLIPLLKVTGWREQASLSVMKWAQRESGCQGHLCLWGLHLHIPDILEVEVPRPMFTGIWEG